MNDDRNCPATSEFNGRVWRCDRTLLAFSIAAILVAIAGASTNESLHVGNDHGFWFDKLCWSNCADVVLLGDSRVHMGVNPAEMSDEWPIGDVKNFGFSGLGYTETYLDAAEQVLRSDSRHRSIVLGITPNSLRTESGRSGQFERSRQAYTKRNHAKARWLGWIERRWPAFNNSSLKRAVFRQGDNPYTTIQHSTGWVEPIALSASAESVLEAYRSKFSREPVSEEVVTLVLRRTRQWTDQGIRVYAFRPPTCEKMEAIEHDLGEFDEERFISQFVNAGGTWISPDATQLETLDASHLDSASARLLSGRLASLMAANRGAFVDPSDEPIPPTTSRVASPTERGHHR